MSDQATTSLTDGLSPLVRQVLTLADLDGRSRPARQAKRLVTAFTSALGGAVEPHQRVAIQRAAELVAIAEQTRALHLVGKATAEDVVRVDNVANRAVKALKLPSRPINRRSFVERLAAASAGQPAADRGAGAAVAPASNERVDGHSAQPQGTS